MNSALAPHLALGCLAREVIEIVMVESRRLEIDATDMMLIACVAYLSTAHALSNPSIRSDYDYGNNPLPLEYCRGIIVKEVAITLNMNRETVRRRLNYLVKRDFLIRDGRCFFIPYQGVLLPLNSRTVPHWLNVRCIRAGRDSQVRDAGGRYCSGGTRPAAG